MMGAYLAQPRLAHLFVGRQGVDTKNAARVALGETQWGRPGALEAFAAETEDARDLGKIVGLRCVDLAVGLGDVEQALEHVLQDVRRVGKQRRELAGGGVEGPRGRLGE